MGGGITGPPGAAVTALQVFDDGSGSALYAGGYFTNAGATAASDLARWNGTVWSSVGGGTSGGVQSFAAWNDGSGLALYVGGQFATAGGVSVNNIAKWNGTSWSPLGNGTSGGGLGYGPSVNALAVYDDGTGSALFAGGGFTSPASEVAKWDGSTWSPLGSGVSGVGGVYALAAYDDGSGPSLFVGGNIGNSVGNGLLRWNGAIWSSIGANFPTYALKTFDDGSGPALYVGGQIDAMGNIARWNGTWAMLGSGVNDRVSTLAADGPVLFAGGSFTAAGGIPSLHAAEWEPCVSGETAPFCFGDFADGLVDCPCSNIGQPGHGCNNSSGSGGALLTVSGNTSPDTILLSVTGELPNATSIFFQGDAVIHAVVFGDGIRCTGGNVLRLYTKQASGGATHAPAAGDPSISARSAALGDPLAPLLTRAYQVYYRDPAIYGCAATFNISNGIRITW